MIETDDPNLASQRSRLPLGKAKIARDRSSAIRQPIGGSYIFDRLERQKPTAADLRDFFLACYRPTTIRWSTACASSLPRHFEGRDRRSSPISAHNTFAECRNHLDSQIRLQYGFALQRDEAGQCRLRPLVRRDRAGDQDFKGAALCRHEAGPRPATAALCDDVFRRLDTLSDRLERRRIKGQAW